MFHVEHPTQEHTMITIRKSAHRGAIDHGWLDARHTFSFGRYVDRDWTHFRDLRVINEDVVAGRMGFSEHPHRDMEIITYPISGTLRHKDSLGHVEDITRGMIQRMSAGSGIVHAETNPTDEPVHLLQIWIIPREEGLAPSHESARIRVHDEPGRFHTLVSEDGRDGSMVMQQDARMLAGVFRAGDAVTYTLGDGRHAWIQIVSGSVRVNGAELTQGDGAAISDESTLEFSFEDDTELLVFDLA
jgi:hypothetical protein